VLRGECSVCDERLRTSHFEFRTHHLERGSRSTGSIGSIGSAGSPGSPGSTQHPTPSTQHPSGGRVITPTHYMILSAALFIIGVVGVMVRRNIIIIFMSIELILNAVNINLIAFSAQLHDQIGQVFAIFVIAVAAAEAAVGLGIILAFYRNKETVNIDEMNLMRW
jgi:NADH-quinone oxidoreductase subunit K